MSKEPRTVGLKTIFDLLKQRPGHLLFGTIFTVLPILLGSFIFVLLSFMSSDTPEVDYNLVNQKGTISQARINDIEIHRNISMNGEHPTVIRFSYHDGERIVEGVFQALDSIKTSRLNIGDTIQIKHFQGQSIITGLKPLGFPVKTLSLILLPFLVVGLIAFALLYWRIKGQIDLFKYGKIVDAEIVSMNATSGLSFSGTGQKVTVHYQYPLTGGQKHPGTSTTSDLTLLTGKKQGDIVKIFVSEDDETKSCLIEKADEIRNNWEVS